MMGSLLTADPAVIYPSNAGINFTHKPSPRTPPVICTKKFSPPWGFCIQAFAQGQGFVGAAPRGWVFVFKQCLPFFKLSLQWQELAIDNTLGFSCCSEILYVFKGNYIQSYVKPKLKNKIIFLIKDRSRL